MLLGLASESLACRAFGTKKQEQRLMSIVHEHPLTFGIPPIWANAWGQDERVPGACCRLQEPSKSCDGFRRENS